MHNVSARKNSGCPVQALLGRGFSIDNDDSLIRTLCRQTS
jgi:hypothetical protein